LVGVLSGETQLGDFKVAGGPIDKGLFTYDLFLDRAPLYTPPGSDDAALWKLASYPDSSATALAQSLNIINNMWDTTAGGWIDRSGDLRSIYGSYGSGGADLPESAAAGSNGPNVNGTWARAIGNWGSRNDSSTIQPFPGQSVTVSADYDESLWAIQGGVDHAFETGKGTVVVGLMGGYEANSVTFGTPGDSANYKAPMAGIYADWINGPAYVDALFKADFLKADLNIGGDSASTDGLALGGRIETGYRYKLSGGWFVEPTASIAYVNTHLDSVSLDNTDVDFDNGESLRGEIGFRSGGAFANADLLFQPYVTASLGNEFLGDNSVFLASGDGVTVTDNVRGIYGKAGLGVNVTNLKRNVSTYLQGTYMFSDDYQSGSAKGGIRFNW
jgi:outer membrane autotransporter protein